MMTPNEIVDLIDRGREAEGGKFPVRGSAAGQCPREMAARILVGSTREVSPRAQRIFDLGTDVGARLAESFSNGSDGKALTEMEVWTDVADWGDRSTDLSAQLSHFWKPELWGESVRLRAQHVEIRSRCDLVWWPDPEGRPSDVILIEFKTKNSYGMKKLKTEGIDEPYAQQVLCQADGLKNADLNVIQAWIVYFNKDNSELVPLEMDLDHDRNYRDTFSQALMAVHNGDLTEAPAVHAALNAKGFLPWQCNYCMVGPEKAGCLPGFDLTDTSTGDVQKWRADTRTEEEPF